MNPRNNGLTLTAILIAVFVMVIHNVSIHPWMIDDAFISFRYAEHLSQGHGMVFNVGERVEGYTSFLWIILLGLGNKLGLDIVLSSKILGFLFGISGLVLLAYSFKFIDGIDRKTAALAAIFTGTCGVFTPWASSGMEVDLYVFLTLASILSYLKARRHTENPARLIVPGALCAVTAISRPEGLILFALMAVDILIKSLSRRDGRAIFFMVSFAIIFLPYFIWRYSYYGFLFPNTFYNKVGFSVYQVLRGLSYTGKFILAALILIIPAFELLFHGHLFRKVDGLLFLVVFAALNAIYTVLVGGDVFPAYRFFAVIIPVLSLLAAVALVNLISSSGVLWRLAFIVALFNVVQLRTNFMIYHVINKLDKVAIEGKEVGLWMKANFDPGATVAVNSAGAVSYYSKLRVIDMLGLTDSHIAHLKMPDFGRGASGHEKGDGKYVLSKRPDYIQFGTTYGWAEPEYIGDRQIFDDPEFGRLYELRKVELPSGHELIYFERSREPDDKNTAPEKPTESGPDK